MRQYRIILFSLLAVLASSCNSDDDEPFDCPGNLQASWKANGVYEESYLGFFSQTQSLLSFGFDACVENDNDKQIAFVYLNFPPTIGTQPLLMGPTFSGVTAQGSYQADVEGDFMTDSVHVGTFTITALDTVQHRLSATFEFVAKNVDDPSQTVQITEGQIYNVLYQN
jgi:hypothetical protein